MWDIHTSDRRNVMGKSPNRKKKNSSRKTISKEALIVEKINSISPSAKRALLGGAFVVIVALIFGFFTMFASQ